MNDIKICSFEEKYIDQILTIENLSFKSPWSKQSMEQELTNKFAKYVLAVKDSMVIGYAGMWIIIDEGHITNVAVHPEFRGIGIGNLLVENLIKVCIEKKLYALTLEVRRSNTVAINLYEKYGFINEGIRKGYYGDNNEDAIIMWKRNFS